MLNLLQSLLWKPFFDNQLIEKTSSANTTKKKKIYEQIWRENLDYGDREKQSHNRALCRTMSSEF